MDQNKMRAHIMQVVLQKLDLDPARRAEALADFLAISLPGLDEAAIKNAAAQVPALPQRIYEKWINLFIERLFETIPPAQLDDLCDGSAANNTTLGMVYLLFMESARMEAQVAQDLAELGAGGGSAPGAAQLDALAAYLRARLAQKTENITGK